MNVEVRNLSFSYGTHKVIKDVSFTAREGKLMFVLGPNGVGKSTIFKCILGLLRGYKGDILIGGSDVKKMSSKNLAHLIAYIPQSHHAACNYSVLEMVLMGTTHLISAFSSPCQKHIDMAARALEQTGIAQMAGKSFMKLSGGEQRLVLIARALAQQSKVLLMDEPTSNLDFGNQLRILQEARRLTALGYTILVSSHNPQHALQFSDSVMALYDGEVIKQGAPNVMDEMLLKRIYGVDVHLIDTDKGRIISSVVRGGQI